MFNHIAPTFWQGAFAAILVVDAEHFSVAEVADWSARVGRERDDLHKVVIGLCYFSVWMDPAKEDEFKTMLQTSQTLYFEIRHWTEFHSVMQEMFLLLTRQATRE